MKACNCSDVYKIYLLNVFIILFYWVILIYKFGKNGTIQGDFMNKKLFSFPALENCCSGWPLSHFAVFFAIGLFYPGCSFEAVFGGILWEVIEVILHYYTSTPRQSFQIDDKVEYSGNWWAGSFKDIIMNILGFYIGKIFAEKYFKCACKNT